METNCICVATEHALLKHKLKQFLNKGVVGVRKGTSP